MAYPRNMLLLVLALILAVSSVPVAHSAYYTLADKNITEARISGQFFCSVTGAPLPGVQTPGLSEAVVDFVCNGTEIAQTLTNGTGHYLFSINTTSLPIFRPSICFTRIDFPVNNCTLFPTDGFVQAAVSLVDIVASTMGAVALFVAELLGICVNGVCTYN